MHPVLFKLTVFGGHIEIGSYRFFLGLAALVGVGLAWLIAGRRGSPARETFILLLATAAAVPVGGRLLHVATNYSYYARDPGRVISTEATGFALFGGLVLAVVVGLAACRLLKLNLWHMADSIVPALAISMALVRIGCFLDGCCAGAPSSLPWAVTLPANNASVRASKVMGMIPGLGAAAVKSLVESAPSHPVDLYELIAALIGAGLAAWLLKRRAPDGVAFLAFALWFSLFRLANHPLRIPASTFAGPAWFYPALYAAAGAIALVALTRLSVPAQSRTASQPIAELHIAAPE